MRSLHGQLLWARLRGPRARVSAWPGIVALVVLFGLWLPSGVARACSCAAPPSPEQALAGSEAVFEARPFSMSNDDRLARYRFEVDRVWKGDIPPRVEITTALHSATCGRAYQIGTKYVIYVGRNQSGEWTDYLCSRTRTSKSAAEDLEVLGSGHPPSTAEIVPPTTGGAEPTEPPRIEPSPNEPPPTEPSKRGCAVEKPHTITGLAWLGLLAIAIRRRRAVRSRPPR